MILLKLLFFDLCKHTYLPKQTNPLGDAIVEEYSAKIDV